MENNLLHLLTTGGLDDEQRAIVEALAQLGRQVRQLRGTFAIESAGRLLTVELPDTDWHELHGLDGIFLRALPELGHGPQGTVDFVAVRGLQGARSPKVRNSRHQVIHVRQGCICLSRAGGPYLPYEVGATIVLDPDEEHGFLAREEFYLLVEYQPRLTSDQPDVQVGEP